MSEFRRRSREAAGDAAVAHRCSCPCESFTRASTPVRQELRAEQNAAGAPTLSSRRTLTKHPTEGLGKKLPAMTLGIKGQKASRQEPQLRPAADRGLRHAARLDDPYAVGTTAPTSAAPIRPPKTLEKFLRLHAKATQTPITAERTADLGSEAMPIRSPNIMVDRTVKSYGNQLSAFVDGSPV